MGAAGTRVRFRASGETPPHGPGGLVLTDFYISFSAVCFTLLGLWLIVVQTRHGEWRASPLHRRRAYGVALHFSLPGVMSLLALVDPESSALWRGSFGGAGNGGGGGGIIVGYG